MTTDIKGFWARQWARIRYVAEAMDMSPADIQDKRIASLERAVADLQMKTATTRRTTADRERDDLLR